MQIEDRLPFSDHGAGLTPPQDAPTGADAGDQAEAALLQYRYAASLMQGDETGKIDLSDQSHLQHIPPVISACRFLTTLNLSGTAVSNLEALAPLPRLERLALWGTGVHDLTPLRHIKTLRWLNLGCTEVTNIDALADLPHLEFLDLSHTPVESLAPLAGNIRMRELILRGSQVTCIAPVSRLRDLMLLDIAGTKVAETRHVAALKNLSWFNTGPL